MVLMAIATAIRMTVLEDAIAYRNNAMMNANLFALGTALLIFGLFNLIFIGGFFKTAYKFGKPFVTHIIVTFVIIGIAEAMHHIPGLEAVNAFGFEHLFLQLGFLALGAVAYIAFTVLSYVCACRSFERIDL